MLYKGQIIGVVGMFSEKKLSPAQFEMLGIFCDHISKEISMLYDIGEFLSMSTKQQNMSDDYRKSNPS